MLLPQVRLRALLCPLSALLYSSARTRISQLLEKWLCVCLRKRSHPCRADLYDHVPCVFSNSAFASVRIPGGVAHIEIRVEVNKWD